MKPLTLRRACKVAWHVRWRAVAAVMVPVYFFTSLPPNAFAAADSDSNNYPGAVLTPKHVHVNTKQPSIKQYAGFQLADEPSDRDLTLCHAFAEPLIPVGGQTTAGENQALGQALKTYLAHKTEEDVSALVGFLENFPNSSWRPSLDLNLAETYYRTGYFSMALAAWQDAWDRTRTLGDPTGQKVANLAVAKLAKMKARVGRTDELDALFKQIKGRNITGQAAQLLVEARSGLWLMHNRPQDAFRCGPAALQELSLATRHKIEHDAVIKTSRSTANGIALSDVQALAGKINMPMQMAKRTSGAEFMVPAVIHWKLGHYAALVGQRDGKYEVHDTTFGDTEFLISAKALEAETSGYFLVSEGKLPQGWMPVDNKEAAQVFGRGNTSNNNPNAFGPGETPSDPDPNGTGGPGGDCGNAGNTDDPDNSGPGSTDLPFDPNSDVAMTQAYVNAMLVGLNLKDNPVRYAPPVGPAMNFTVDYNQRDNTQPTTFTYGNLGPGWTYNYLSYVVPGASTSTVYERGGGVGTFYFNSGTSSWTPNQKTGAVLSQVNSTTWQIALSNGEIETYGKPDGSGRFFLSQITDPHNNALNLSYDSNFRLVSLTDALGQVTTVAYESNSSANLPAFYQIAKVTDPFGRYAQFSYDSSGQLQQITDIFGIKSQFNYLSNGFITSLTTPYGVTTFTYADISTNPNLGTTRWLNVTYPDGKTTRTEFNETQVPSGVTVSNGVYADTAGVPAGMYPTGLTVYNDFEQDRNTYFWDKQAMKDHAGDYTQAKVIHWMHTSDINTTSNIEESHKSVDQNRIWFAYGDGNPGQMSSIQASNTMIAKPTVKGRILDDGSTQLFQYQYNAIGKVTQAIDPLGRETDYTYAANNVDLLTVKQKNGSGSDTLFSTLPLNYNSQHEPLSTTDASGQVTYYNYYPNGQLNYVVNPKNQRTTYGYNSSGYLTSITGPVAGATVSFGYDGFGRVQTATDSQGYVTTSNYDALDRPTLVIYPDGTTSQMNYSNLDLQYTKDRLGRWTHIFYNSLRQPTSVMDAMGNVATFNYTLSAGLSSIVDAAGHTTTWLHDNQNRVVEKDYPDGTKQKIAFENTTSRVKSTTDAMNQTATITYTSKQVTVNGTQFNTQDKTVAQVAYTNATVTTPSVSYHYDPVYPRITTMIDGTGTTTYNYNAVTGSLGSGRLSSVVTPLATISYSSAGTPLYDELGRNLGESINDSSTGQGLSDNSYTVIYDTLGRVQTSTNPLASGGSFAYAYLNQTDRPTSVTNPNGQKAVYTYQDSLTTPHEPRLSEIKNVAASAAVISKFDYGYDASGQITSWTQQTDNNDPQNWALQYDNEGKLIGVNITDTTTSGLLHQYAYTYDAVGNRTTEQIDGNVTTSTYKPLTNQLMSQTAGGSGNMVFSGTISKYSTVTVGGNPASLDANNNFRGTATVNTGTNLVPIVATDVDGNVSTNTYKVVVPSGTGTSYGYDNNGSLLTDGTRTFGWDAKKELVSIIYNSGPNSGNHTEFTYNGGGERVKIVERTGTTIGSGTVTSTKQYVWAGGMAEERDVNNKITKRYFDQGEQRINTGVATNYYYTFDYLGSVREMVDSAGTIQARYSYDPYGRATQISGSLSCDFQYAGMYEHATSGLNLAQFRAYNPNLGRWLSRDPLGESEGMNLYAYCNGDPINNIDPLGTSIVGKVIVQGLKYGRKIFGKKLSLKEAGDALKDGEDILASNRGQAQKIAQAGSEPGKAPIFEVDKSTGKPHYHPNPRTGGHVVWGISELGSAASYFTVSHYANELNGAGYSSSFSSGVQDYAYAVDLVNPLSVFQDITDIASTAGGGDSGDSVPEQTAPESTSDGSDASDNNCIDNPPIDPTSIPAPWQM